jgi:hypothetical protein
MQGEDPNNNIPVYSPVYQKTIRGLKRLVRGKRVHNSGLTQAELDALRNLHTPHNPLLSQTPGYGQTLLSVSSSTGSGSNSSSIGSGSNSSSTGSGSNSSLENAIQYGLPSLENSSILGTSVSGGFSSASSELRRKRRRNI